MKSTFQFMFTIYDPILKGIFASTDLILRVRFEEWSRTLFSSRQIVYKRMIMNDTTSNGKGWTLTFILEIKRFSIISLFDKQGYQSFSNSEHKGTRWNSEIRSFITTGYFISSCAFYETSDFPLLHAKSPFKKEGNIIQKRYIFRDRIWKQGIRIPSSFF